MTSIAATVVAVIIDDERSNVELLTQILERSGFQSITGLTDASGLVRDQAKIALRRL